ncbi:MAG: hypothetical protein GY833_12455 [Aestuariibacter sp.]|nr:hypothetical protein [Aestuariibacter sp.]|tara:strand:- start:81308 stop:81607 length:300 start_codon:yes stop_codon:yes gene_type:complete
MSSKGWLYGEPMNGRAFQHSANGFDFFSERCDFKDGLYVVKPDTYETSESDLIAATAHVVGYHACNVRPELNGFAGYDAITFKVVSAAEAGALKASFGL